MSISDFLNSGLLAALGTGLVASLKYLDSQKKRAEGRDAERDKSITERESRFMAEIERQNKELLEEVKQLRSEITAERAENKSLVEEVERLRTEVAAEREARKKTERQSEQRGMEIEKLTAQSEQLTAQVERMADEIRHLTDELKETRTS